jgi:VWFA-related protein
VQAVAAAAREGMQQLQEGDRVAVMAFNTKTRTLLPFTDDLDRVQHSIAEDLLGERFGGGTFLQSAISDAARRFMQEPRTERRRAILVITDDMGQRTRRESTVVRELWEADALVSGLIVRGGTVQTMRRINTVINPSLIAITVGVRGIAEKTGGDFIASGDPAGGFEESMRRIRNRYSIYYAMPAAEPKKRRKIRVELTPEASEKHPKAKVRARTGYYAPEEPALATGH